MAEITSILDSVKKNLGIDSAYDAFDADIITHINSVFFTLNSLGLGPTPAFSIEDSSKNWTDFQVDPTDLQGIKSYMYLKIRLIFDPPATSFTIAAFEKQIQEFEFRLNVNREDKEWTPAIL